MYANISTLTEAQIEQLHQLYQHEFWSRRRTLSDVRKMLLNSDYLFGICDAESQQLVAFARVLSDRTYRALVFDVIVAGDRLFLYRYRINHSSFEVQQCI